MTNKLFLDANTLLKDSYALAAQVIESGYRPDFVIGVWRGGTPIAIAAQSVFAYCGIVCDHVAIRTSAYEGTTLDLNRKVKVLNTGYVLEKLHKSGRVLIVDDVFDTGRSIEAIYDYLQAHVPAAQMPESIRTATVFYKPTKNLTSLQPDYYLHETDRWIVFPHEIEELSLEDICDHKGYASGPIVELAKKGLIPRLLDNSKASNR